MIVLDTNVLSEPMRRHADAGVLTWLAGQSDTATTAVTVGELLVGVRALPAGKRRAGLLETVERALAGQRILAYDQRAAREYALIRSERRQAGKGLTVEDGMIAAIARSVGATLATRNVRDFDGLGIDLVNPWADPQVS